MSELRRKQLEPAPAPAVPVRRRWLRRTTYVLVAGTALLGLAAAWLHTPSGGQWLLARVDGVLRDATGLGLTAREARFYLPSGRLVLEDLDLGEGLLRARRFEVSVRWAALVQGRVHVRSLELLQPRVNVTPARLAALRLKERPPSGPPTWQVDQATVRQGQGMVAGWAGLRGEATWDLTAQGAGPGCLNLTGKLGRWALRGPGPRVAGSAELKLSLRPTDIQGEARIAAPALSLELKGRHGLENKTFDLRTTLRADVGRWQGWLGSAPLERGWIQVRADGAGTLADPHWKAHVQGEGLAAPRLGITEGKLGLQARGSLKDVQVDQVSWASAEGALEGRGRWLGASGLRLELAVKDADLAPWAKLARAPLLQPLRADAHVVLSAPRAPWHLPQVADLKAESVGTLRKQGAAVGQFQIVANQGLLDIATLNLNLPELRLDGSGSLSFSKNRLVQVEGSAHLHTDAATVAEGLQAWGIGFEQPDPEQEGRKILLAYPMAGRTEAHAALGWNQKSGLVLSGWVDVLQPRWEGAQADRVRGDVSLVGDELRVSQLELEKGEGRGRGDLWLTWADLAPGARQMDMCYTAHRLPMIEGIRAAALDPLEFPIHGMASGWARIAGPYTNLELTGSLIGEKATVYGLSVPAASADFTLGLSDLRMAVRDIRVAESVDALGRDDGGLLALRGQLDMDLERETWRGQLTGRVDSGALSLPGPRWLAHLDARFHGPMVTLMGPTLLPTVDLQIRRGRVFLGSQSLEGLEGGISLAEGGVDGWLGFADRKHRLLQVRGWRQEQRFLGALDLAVDEATVDTEALASRLTQDVLRHATLHASAEGVWEGEGLRWDGRLQTFEARFPGFTVVQNQSATVSGTERGMTLGLELAGVGSDLAPGATLGMRGYLPFAPDRPVALHLSGAADLAKVKGIVDALARPGQYSLLGDLQAAGKARLGLTLGGTFREPLLDGRMDLEAGRLRIRTYLQSAEEVRGSLQFKGRDLVIPESSPLQGRLASGALSVWGKASWAPWTLSQYAFQAQLNEFQFRGMPEGFELQGSARALLTGTSQRAKLLGFLDAKRLLYRADVRLADVILASASGMGPAPGFDPEDPLRHIDLDLELRLAEPWQFDTNLLKLQGRPVGRFQVLGSLAQPGLKGLMEFVPGGRITNLLPAGDVVVERGSIDFKDPRQFNPILNVQGRVDVSPFVVNLGIQGSLDQLTLTPTSTPSLRQDEIVAILIDPALAHSVGNISGSAAGTAAHYGLANTTTGVLSNLAIAGFQEQVRQTLNLDRVSFALRPGTGTPEMTFTVGKSLDLFGHRTPLVVTHRRAGDVVTLSGQLEWRFGNFVLQMGASRSGTADISPSGEVRYLWSPR